MIRAAIFCLLLPAAALSAVAGDGDPFENPFKGWTADQIDTHTKNAQGKIKGMLRRVLTARKSLLMKCSTCRGTGKVAIRGLGRRGTQIRTCVTCAGTGTAISRKNVIIVYHEYLPPDVKGSPEFVQSLEDLYKASRSDPRRSPIGKAELEGWKKKEIEVLGNHARAHVRLKRGGAWLDEKVLWIQPEPPKGGWYLAPDPLPDRFVEHEYSKEPAAASPAPTTEPQPRPPTPQPKPPTPQPKPPQPKPEPKPPLEDPAKLFRVSTPKITSTTEGAFKVFGQVTNTTKDRRFAYIVVEVSLFRGDEIVETTECNIGARIIGPGRTATFGSYFYVEKLPRHDRVEAVITKYEQLK